MDFYFEVLYLHKHTFEVKEFKKHWPVTLADRLNQSQIRSIMDENKKRQGNYAHIADVLPGIVKTIRRESASELSKIRDEWDRIVDPAIAAHTRPEALKNDILLVKVASSTLAHRLRFMTPGLISEINRVMGEGRITEIRYTTGDI